MRADGTTVKHCVACGSPEDRSETHDDVCYLHGGVCIYDDAESTIDGDASSSMTQNTLRARRRGGAGAPAGTGSKERFREELEEFLPNPEAVLGMWSWRKNPTQSQALMLQDGWETLCLRTLAR